MKHELKKPKEPAVVMFWSQQSPIDLGKSLYAPGLPPVVFNYEGIELKGKYDDDNFVVDVADAWKCQPEGTSPAIASICYEGIKCPLVKIHFHASSEHSLDFIRTPLEVHLIHKVPVFPESYPSAYIVVGVMYEFVHGQKKSKKKEGKQRTLEDFLLRHFLTAGDGGCHTVHPSVFLPGKHVDDATTFDFYRYEGSLTTPPFSENVSWIVLREHNEIDTSDEVEVKGAAHEPARELQPVNRRFVLRNFP